MFVLKRNGHLFLCVQGVIIWHTNLRLVESFPNSAESGFFIAFLCIPKVYLQNFMCSFFMRKHFDQFFFNVWVTRSSVIFPVCGNHTSAQELTECQTVLLWHQP